MNTNTEKTLSSLRLKLDRLDILRAEKSHASFGHADDLSGLIGLEKSEIRELLGDPKICDETFFCAPCKKVGDWFYSFYTLPPLWCGGGPEVLLQFDEQGKCIAATWEQTE